MPEHEDLLVTSADGTRISVIRSGRGHPLVLVHGTTVNHSDWDPLLLELNKHFTVYAMDRRGLGASEDPPGYSIEREYEDIAAVIASTGEPAHVMGHSFGGLCSLEAALQTPLVSKLIIYEPPIPTDPYFYPEDILERFDQLMDAGRPDEVLATFMREVARQSAERVELQRRSPRWPNRVAVAHTAVREVRASHDYHFQPERFQNLMAPTLLILGEHAFHGHINATKALQAALPNARTVLLPGQGHIAMHTAPGLYLDEVLRFLSP